MIVEAAQSILLSEGFAALTLRNTAQAADIRMATLQYYFPSREVLFEQAFQDIVDRAWKDVVDELNQVQASRPEEKLRCFVKSMCEASRDAPLVGCFVELWSAARVHAYAADIMRVYYDDAVRELAKLQKGVNPSRSHSQNRQLAVLSMSMIEGLALFNQIDREAARRSRVPIDTAVESIMKLIK